MQDAMFQQCLGDALNRRPLLLDQRPRFILKALNDAKGFGHLLVNAEAISKIEYLDLDLSYLRWQPPKEPAPWLAWCWFSGAWRSPS
jgi:hypothetical protein